MSETNPLSVLAPPPDPDMAKVLKVERRERVFLTWTIHHSCNYRCPYCFITTGRREIFNQNTYPGFEKLKAVWQRIYDLYGSCIIKIAGGEPFTYPQFMDIIAYLAQYHFLDFSTNLYWDVDEFIRRIPKGSARLEPSYHVGFTPDIVEFAEKCLKLKAAGFMGSIHTVGFPPFLPRLLKNKEYFESRGLNLVVLPFRGSHLGKEYPNAYTDEQKTLLKLAIAKPETKAPPPAPAAVPAGNGAASAPAVPAQTEEQIDKDREHIKKVNEQYFSNYVDKENLFPEQQTRWCLQGSAYGKIQPNLEVLRCCTPTTPEKRKSLVLGNLLDPDFKLLDGAKQCDIAPCGCWKTMLMGQEAKWKPLWAFNTYSYPAGAKKAAADEAPGQAPGAGAGPA
jgi:hypothetical protein